MSDINLGKTSLRSHAVALASAFLVVASGALAAHTSVLPQIAANVATTMRDTTSGFKSAFGGIPAHIAQNISEIDRVMRAQPARVAEQVARASADITPGTFDLAFVQPPQLMNPPEYSLKKLAAVRASDAPILTPDMLRVFALDTLAKLASPSKLASVLVDTHSAIGVNAYEAIAASFAAYDYFVGDAGAQALALGATTRDALATAPALVTKINLAFGNAIIRATHAAIRAEVGLAYETAETAPKTARATVALLGGTGDLLARATARVPKLATDSYLRATAVPATVAPAIAQAVFDAEYKAALQFLPAARLVTDQYLAVVQDAGEITYAGTKAVRHMSTAGLALAAQSVNGVPRLPAVAHDAYLGALGKSALAFQSFEGVANLTLDIINHVPGLAAVLAAAQPILSPAEQAALAVYETVHNFFETTSSTLAVLFTPKTTLIIPNTVPIVATSTIVQQQTTNSFPTYTTVVQGVSPEELSQSITASRNTILTTVAGMIQPVANQVVTNQTTIQQVNMIQDLSNLIVRNGDFRGGSLTSGVNVSATTGSFDNLTGGAATLGSATISGTLTVNGIPVTGGGSGSGNVSTSTLETAGNLPYWTSTSGSPATLGSAANLTWDNTANLFSVVGNASTTQLTTTGSTYLATTGGNVGIGTTSPWAQLSVNPSGITGPAFVVGSSTATNFIVTNGGRVGIGKSNPTVALDVTGAVTLTGALTAGIQSVTAAEHSLSPRSNIAGTNPVLGLDQATAWTGGFITAAKNSITKFTLDNTGSAYFAGSIGVGTSSSYSLISISNSATTAANTPLFTIASTTGGTSTTTLMTVLANGSVGIGKVPTAGKLDVNGEIDALGIVSSTYLNSGTTISVGTTIGDAADRWRIDPANRGGFVLANNTVLGWVTSGTTNASPSAAFSILSGGVIGVGTGAAGSAAGTLIANTIGVGTTSPWGQLSASSTSASPTFVVEQKGSGAAATFLGGSVGIGTTSPATTLAVGGSGYFTGGLGVGVLNTTSGSLQTTGDATIGSDLLIQTILNCNSSSNAIQSDGSGQLVCGTITAIGGTSAGGWTSLAPNIVRLATTTDLVGIGFSPISTSAKLTVNSGAAATTTLSLQAVSGQTANILEVYDNTLTLNSVITPTGKLGIGTTSPYANFSIATPNGATGSQTTLFAIASSTASATTTVVSVSNTGTLSLPWVGTLANPQLSFGIPGNTSAIFIDSGYQVNFANNGSLRANVQNDGFGINGGTYRFGTAGPFDLGISRNAAGVVEINSGTTGQLRDITVRSASTTGQTVLATTGGNVGIGTTSPPQALSVQGNGYFSGTGFFGGAVTATSTYATTFNGSIAFVAQPSGGNATGFGRNGSTGNMQFYGGDNSPSDSNAAAGLSGTALALRSTMMYGWSSSANAGNPSIDTGLSRLSAGVIGVGTGAAGSVAGTLIAGRLGLGTTSPYSLISISNSATTAANTPLFTIASTTGGTSTTTLMTVLATGQIVQNTDAGLASSALLVDIQNNGTTRFNVSRAGVLTLAASATGPTSLLTPGTFNGDWRIGTNIWSDENGVGVVLKAAGGYRWSSTSNASSGTFDTSLHRLSAGVVAVGTGAAGSTAGTLIANTIGIGTTSPYSLLSIAGAAGGVTNLFSISTSTSGFATTTALSINQNGDLSLLNGANLSVSGRASFTGSTTLPLAKGNFLVGDDSGVSQATSSIFIFSTGGLLLRSGSLAAPAIQLGTVGGNNNAIYSNNGALVFADDGQELVAIDINYPGVKMRSAGRFTWTSGNTPSTADPDTGLSRLSAGVVGLGTGGAASVAGTLIASSTGLGTTTPWAKLSIAGSSLVDSTQPLFSISSSTANSTTTIFHITSQGNVGVGTTSPSQALSVTGTIYTTAGIQFPDGSVQTAAAASNAVGTVGQVGYYATGGSTLSGTSTLFIASNQNVGIGTTSPWGKLSINNSTNDPAGQPLFVVASSTASATTTQFIVTNTGNVGIGTTSPATTLSVAGNSYVSGFYNTSGITGGYKIDGNLILYASSTNNTVALGNLAGTSFTTLAGAINNTALGYNALNGSLTTAADYNTAVGGSALSVNTSGSGNTAVGQGALQANTTGSQNIAIGVNSLITNSIGASNIAIGFTALNNTTGSNNIGLGNSAGQLTTGNNNLFLGHLAGDNLTTGSNNIVIGYDIDAPAAASANTLNIGNLIFGTGIDGTGTTLSTGKIGIGTTSPSQLLSVHGNGLFSGDLSVANLTATGTLSVAGLTTLANASSSNLSISNNLWVGGNATTTSNGTFTTNGSIGIGTSTPFGVLSLITPDTTVKPTISIRQTNGFNYGFDIDEEQQSVGRLDFYGVQNGGRIQIMSLLRSGGGVGIGTIAPASQLDVSNAGGGILTLSRNDTAVVQGDIVGGINFWGNDAELTTQNLYAKIETQVATPGNNNTDEAAGNLLFYTTGSTIAGSPIERMRIDSSGRLGVGTTSPWGQLSINNSTNSPAGQPLFVIASSTANSTTTQFIITNSGYVGIGTSSPAYNLSVSQATSTVLANAIASFTGSGGLGNWTTTTSLATGVLRHTAVVAGGYMYVIGGSVGGTAQTNVQYAKINANGTVGSWASTTPLATAESLHTSVAANGYVYAIGGTGGGDDTVQYAKVNANGTLGSWQTTTVLGTGQNSHSSVVANGFVYALGGVNDQTLVQYARLNADGTVGSWQTTTALPTLGAFNHTSVVANGYVYAVGGNDGIVATTTVTYAKLNSDGTLGSWTTATSLGVATQAHSSVVANGYIYVLGGATNTNTVQYAKLNSDGTLGSWQYATALSTGEDSAAAVVANGYIYVLGGNSATKTLVQYAPLQRVMINGNIDLLGLAGGTLGDANSNGSQGSTGGSIFAGNIFSNGTLEVTGNALLSGGLGVNGNFTLNATTSRSQNSAIFSLNNATGTSPILSALYNGNVGIGTTSPWAQLSINPNGITGPAFAIGSSTETNFIVTNGGNVGIGTTTDTTSKLTIGGVLSLGSFSTSTKISTLYRNLGGGVRTAIGLDVNPSLDPNGSGGNTVYGVYSEPTIVAGSVAAKSIGIYSNPSGPAGATLYSALLMGGNVGVGTTSPYAKLSVVGQTVSEYFTATSTTLASTFPYASSTALTVSGTGGLQLATGLNGPLQANAGLVSATTSIGVLYGGTGTTTAPVSQLLYGGTGGIYQSVATSSLSTGLGLSYSGTLGALVGGVSGSLTIATSSLYTGTTGQLPYFSGTNTLTATSSIFLAASGNLGIGTTSPWAQLSINPNGITGPAFAIGSSTATNFIVTNGGLVGIGTTSPQERLTLRGGNFFQAGGDGMASSTPTIVGGVKDATNLDGAFSVYVSGRYAYVASQTDDSLRIIDVSNPSSPVVVGGVKDATNLDAASSVFVSGRYAYVTSLTDDSLRIIDVSNPASPIIVGGVKDATNLDRAFSVYVSGRYAYVANQDDDSLRIIDVSNPAAPFIVGGVKDATNLNGASSVFVSGRYAYVANSVDDSLRIIDVSNPASPTIVGGVKDATNLDFANSVFVSGRYAYVASQIDDSVRIIDVSNPASPTIVGGVKDATNLNAPFSVFVSGRYAYVANISDDSLRIIDVSSSTAPVMVGGIKNATNLDGALSVFVSGRYAYVANTNDDSLRIIDISGIEVQSAIVHSLEAGTLQVKNDVIADGQLYVRGGLGIGQGGLFSQGFGSFTTFATTSLANLPALSASIIDSNGSGVVDVLTINHSASSTASNGIGAALLFSAENTSGTTTSIGRIAAVFTAAGGTATTSALTFSTLSGFTLSEKMRLDQNGNLGIGTTSPWAQLSINPNGITGPAFAIGSSTATNFIVTNGGNVGIGTSSPYARLSISASSTNPAFAILQSTSTTATGALMSFLSNTYASTTGASTTPQEFGNVRDFHMKTAGSVSVSSIRDVYVSGRYAYTANGNSVTVVDISNPASPISVGSVTDAAVLNGPSGISVAGRYAYVTTTNRLTIIDVSKPNAPKVVGTVQDTDLLRTGDSNSIVVSGRYAYVAASFQGRLTVVDISNPTAPFIVGSLLLSASEFTLSIAGHYAYMLADAGGTLSVIDIANPSNPMRVGSVTDSVRLAWQIGSDVPHAIYASGRYVYVASKGSSTTGGFTVVDVSNPASPSIVGYLTDNVWLDRPTNVFVSGRYAYVSSRPSGNNYLTVIDISVATNPTIVGTFTIGSTAVANYVSGRYAYIAENGSGFLRVVDLAGIDMPTALIGNLQSSSITAWDNIDVGNNLYVRGGLNLGQGGLYANGSGSFIQSTSTSLALSPTLSAATFDSNTSSNVDVMTLTHGGWATTTPGANGISTGLLFAAGNTSATTTDIARIAGVFTAAGGTATTSALTFSTLSGFTLSEKLRIDSTGNVGIGTTSPWAQLSINPNGISGPAFAIGSTTGTRFIVTNGGNVGIGTTSPQERLTLRGGNFFQAGGDVTASSTPTIIGGVKDATNLDGASSVYVSGRYAYVANQTDDSFRIIDVSNPAAPVIVGGVKDSVNLDSAISVFVSGRYAYVANYGDNSLRIIDVSNPAAPVIVGGVKDSVNLAGPHSVFVSGRYAYVANLTDDSLRIIDVSNPAAPFIVGGVKDATNLDTPRSVFVSGQYAYVANETDDSLRIIDVSNPAAPFIVGGVKDATNLNSPQSVFVSGRYAYVASNLDDSLRIIDVSNPAAPVIVGGVKDSVNLDTAGSVYVSGRYAYVANRNDDSLRIIDVASSTAPFMVGGVKDATNLDNIYSVFVSGRYAYVANQQDDSLRIIDISGIEVQSAIVHSLEAGTLQVKNDVIADGQLYVRGGLGIGQGGLFSQGAGTFSMFATTSLAATPALSVGIADNNLSSVVDVANLFHTSTSSTSVIASGIGTGLLFSSATYCSLANCSNATTTATSTARIASVFTNVSTSTPKSALAFYVKGTPGSLTEAMRIDSTGNVGIGTTSPWAQLSINPNGITGPAFAIGSTSAATTSSFVITNGLKVGIGTTSPQEKLTLLGGSFLQAGGDALASSTPTIVGGVQDSTNLDSIRSVFVSGRYAYVANQVDDSLRIIDVSDPTTPVIVGGVKDATNLDGAFSVYVSGRYAYVVSLNDDSLRIIDVSSPTSPVIVGGVKDATNLDGAISVYVSGRYAYVANSNDNSLRIIDVSSPTTPIIVGGVKDNTNLAFAESVFVSGRYAYVANNTDDSLRIIDVSSPTAPVMVGGVKDATNLNGAASVYVSGRYAYVANDTDNSLRIIDVSNPASPVIVGGVKATHLSGAISVYVSGRYAYVANLTGSSLRIIDVASSTAPFMVGGIQHASLANARSVYVSGRYAYVAASSDDSLRIIDISGIEVQSALVHSLEAGTLQVKNDITADGQLYIRGGLGIGQGGLYSSGSGSFVTYATTSLASSPSLTAGILDSNTSSVADVANLFHMGTSTSVVSSGIGTGLLFSASTWCSLANCANATTTATSTARIASIFTNVSTSSPASALAFYTKNTAGSLTEWMRLNQNGNLGIGTTTPTNKLTINGDLNASDYDSEGQFSIRGATAGSKVLMLGVDTTDNFAYIQSSQDGVETRPLVLQPISGNVGIGTTSPFRTFSISSTESNGTFIRLARRDGVNDADWDIKAGNATTKNLIILNASNGTSALTISGVGNHVTPGADNTQELGSSSLHWDCFYYDATSLGTCTSDASLKSNVQDLSFGPDPLGQLVGLTPRTFEWNDNLGVTNYGFIAQEVQAVAPELVATSTAGHLQVKYGYLQYLTIEAIKELNRRTSFINSATTSTVLTVDSSGNIGIGTTTPNHTLSVAGDIGALAFVNTSARSTKTGITYLNASSTKDTLSQLVNLKVATYRYTIEDQNDPLRLGLIAEDAATIAPEILSPDGKGVDIYKLATFTLAGVQALAAKVDEQETRIASLEERMELLESGAISTASGSPFTLGSSTLASALESFGVFIQKGVAQFNTLVFRQLVATSDEDGTSSAGSVTIIAGNTIAQVNNSLVKATTKVFVTFNSSVIGSWWVSDKAEGSFRVVLSGPQASDVSFDYFLVQTVGQIATSTPETGSAPSVSQSNGLDTVPPVITLLGDNPFYLSVGGTFNDPGVTITDNAGGTVPYTTFINGIEQEVAEGTIDTSSPTTYLVTYRAMDAAGNVSTAIRSIIVGNPDGTVSTDDTATSTPSSSDVTPPVVTLTGSAALEMNVGDTFSDPGATAIDDTDGDISPQIVVAGTVDTTTAGLYTLTYTATDAAGSSASVSRVVTVVAPSDDAAETP